MVSFSVENLQELMSKPRNIRNLSIIAQPGHGKQTLTGALLASAGLTFITEDNTSSNSDHHHGSAVSSGNSLLCKMAPEEMADERMPKDSDGREFLINLIEAPGHADLSDQVSSALRITDGALVVVDCIEGLSLRTEILLRQAMGERIKPIVTINKLDRGFLELQLDWESFYINFSKQISDVNEVISMYHDNELGDLSVHPHHGTVAFSAGMHGWGFTLPQFGRLYSKKFGISEEKMCERLWGDNFFISTERRWAKTADPQYRAFNLFVLDPIGKIFSACMNDQVEKLQRMMTALSIRAKKSDLELQGKELLMKTMENWLPVHKALEEMMILHLPSPCVAQCYRTGLLYTGPMDDQCALGMAACDPSAPLLLYVSKMVPSPDKGRFIGFGRVFSGTVRSGEEVRIMGPNFVANKKDDLYVKSIQKIVLFLGRRHEVVEEVIAGNTCGLVGIDQFLVRSGTIADGDGAHPIKDMSFSTSPVVRCAVEPKRPQDLPKLVEALQALAKGDPMVSVTVEESGEHVVGGSGYVHMEICVRALHDAVPHGLLLADVAVTYRETVTALRPDPCASQSPNRHNRLVCAASPLGEELASRIDAGDITPTDDVNLRAALLQEHYGWDSAPAHRIWAFGPDGTGPNMLADRSEGALQQEMNEIKDAVLTGFSWVAREGVLCEEALRGVCFGVLDASLHADAIHRGAGQIIPTARRVMFAAEMAAGPRLMEPVFLVEIQCTESSLPAIEATLDLRRGVLVEATQRPGTPVFNLRAFLPVAESLGFDSDLRAETAGQAFPQCMFNHWQLVDGDPLAEGPVRDQLIAGIRRRKGLNTVIPPLERYRDS